MVDTRMTDTDCDLETLPCVFTMCVSMKLKRQRAGGDIKRNDGPDPYSYVPIGQATKGKKGSHAPRINLTNKKKGSSGRR